MLHPTPLSCVTLHPAPLSSVMLHPAPLSSVTLHPTPQSSVMLHPTPQSSVMLHPTPQSITGGDVAAAEINIGTKVETVIGKSCSPAGTCLSILRYVYFFKAYRSLECTERFLILNGVYIYILYFFRLPSAAID